MIYWSCLETPPTIIYHWNVAEKTACVDACWSRVQRMFSFSKHSSAASAAADPVKQVNDSEVSVQACRLCIYLFDSPVFLSVCRGFEIFRVIFFNAEPDF